MFHTRLDYFMMEEYVRIVNPRSEATPQLFMGEDREHVTVIQPFSNNDCNRRVVLLS